jgi:hypothetical protein
MARVTFVKAAQQRYKTVPVLDSEGNPVYREVALSRATKSGKTSYRQRVTVEDRNQPLPPEKCDFPGCGKDILPGQAYKWIKPKSGPYGGRKRSRHAEHDSWREWEYSNSLSARIAQICYNVETAEWETKEDVEQILASAAEEIRELAEEKRESAESIESGFNHPTVVSEELSQMADDLDAWADEVEYTDVPDEPEETDYEPDEGDEDGENTEYEEAHDQWVEEIDDILSSIGDGSPA